MPTLWDIDCVCFRSGKGAIHVWNLNTRRPERVLESHAGNSVIWLQALKESSTLIRYILSFVVCMFINMFISTPESGEVESHKMKYAWCYSFHSEVVCAVLISLHLWSCMFCQSGSGHTRVRVGSVWRPRRSDRLSPHGQCGLLSMLSAGDSTGIFFTGSPHWTHGGGETLKG